jgi:hypothetical protein
MISNGFRKFKNPTNKTDNENKLVFIGNIKEFTGLNPIQHMNYIKIQESLEQFNIKLETIYYRSWVYNGKNRTNFLVTSNNIHFIWQKYESNSDGSSQNFIYFKNKKINTTKWLNFSLDEIKSILDE